MSAAQKTISKNLDAELVRLIEGGSAPERVLLHACCAPCATAVVERLCAHFEVTLYFFNPCIMPEDEYNKRAGELEKLRAKFPIKDIIIEPYDVSPFLAMAKGLENEPEGGARCRECFSLRLSATARTAEKLGFEAICSTLSISPHKNALAIYEAGCAAAQKEGILYLPSDFKKGGGFLCSTRLCEELSIYRQVYCGCDFSRGKTGDDKF